jgi:hypothetical protein
MRWLTPHELSEGLIMNLLLKILVMVGSSASIGLGVWHFFVPKAWNWCACIDTHATELVAAVRATKAFFSLSLFLFGIVDILLIYGDRSNRHSIVVLLAATCILWLTRVALQVIYPQGAPSSGTRVWNVVGVCDRDPVLRNPSRQRTVPKNPCLAQRQSEANTRQVPMDSSPSPARLVCGRSRSWLPIGVPPSSLLMRALEWSSSQELSCLWVAICASRAWALTLWPSRCSLPFESAN